MARATELEFQKVIDSIRRESRRPMEATGHIAVESSVIPWRSGQLALHSDLGPPDQDKDVNQDFVLGWSPMNGNGTQDLDWAVALADGVTSSWQAELGAEIVCWSALRTLMDHATGDTWDEIALRAMHAASGGLGRLSAAFLKNADALRPDTEFPASWRYMLDAGLYFQTTLLLAWCAGGVVHLVSIGDAGAAIRTRASTATAEDDRILLHVNSAAEFVHALGPHSGADTEPDAVLHFDADTCDVMALYTDGIGRLVQPGPELLFALYDEEWQPNGRGKNPARATVESLMEQFPQELQDNLSLVLISHA